MYLAIELHVFLICASNVQRLGIMDMKLSERGLVNNVIKLWLFAQYLSGLVRGEHISMEDWMT